MNKLININQNESISKFLEDNNLNKFKLIKIKQDASSRIYYRIKNKNLILMISKDKENKNKEFIKLSKHLNNIKFSAPKIVAQQHRKGLYIIEDFGNLTFSNAIKKNIEEKKLYINAIKMLIALQQHKTPSNLPKYNFHYLKKELDIFIEWYFKEKNIKLNEYAIEKWNTLWRQALSNIYRNNDTLVLRDFHADNLFWLPKRHKIKKIGLIDFQDALVGHITYDLASLLEDVRRIVSKETKELMLENFIKLKKIKNKNLFYENYYTISAQRNAKIVGIFIRLARRDKKYSYLKLVNRALKSFITSLKIAKQNELLDWLNTYALNDKIRVSNEYNEK